MRQYLGTNKEEDKRTEKEESPCTTLRTGINSQLRNPTSSQGGIIGNEDRKYANIMQCIFRASGHKGVDCAYNFTNSKAKLDFSYHLRAHNF